MHVIVCPDTARQVCEEVLLHSLQSSWLVGKAEWGDYR